MTRIGEAHHRLGVAPRWYIGGYSFVLAGLLKAIQNEYPEGLFNGKAMRDEEGGDAGRGHQGGDARHGLFDIGLYRPRRGGAQGGRGKAAADKKAAEEQIAATRKATMDKLADDFEQAVGDIVATVSSASTELEAAAQTHDQDRRRDPAALDRRRRGVGGGLLQRRLGRLGDRGDVGLGARDQPPGPGIRAASPARRSTRREKTDARIARAVGTRPAASATSSS